MSRIETTRRMAWQALLSLLVAGAVIALIIAHQRSAPANRPAGRPGLPTGWQKLENCRLLAAPSNDGDSFLVGHAGGTDTFRLYFVDCPEKEPWHGDTKRLEDQAAYFSLPSPQAAALVGRAAEQLVQNLMARPFTVFTKHERVYDSRRFYAQVIVETADEGPQDLASLLVRHGMARIYTKGTTLPDGMGEREFKETLHRLEAATKAGRKGAWQGL